MTSYEIHTLVDSQVQKTRIPITSKVMINDITAKSKDSLEDWFWFKPYTYDWFLFFWQISPNEINLFIIQNTNTKSQKNMNPDNNSFHHCGILFSFSWLKVNKFQNENMKSSHCPKYERKNLKNSALSVQGRIFQIFRSYFGQWDDSIFSFWNFLTFTQSVNAKKISKPMRSIQILNAGSVAK
jgi:hypothetical protein